MEPQATSTAAGLAVEALGCARGERMVFRGVSLTLPPGHGLIVRGSNGAGKSTLLRILAGLLRAGEGTIRLDGSDMADDVVAYRRNIAFVGHLDALKPGETPLQAMRFRRQLHGVRGPGALSALQDLGLGSERDRPCRLLSAGQRRRVALAGLIATHARLWLADEPTATLDARSGALFQTALDRHLRAGGMAVITTHDREAWPDACSELVLAG